MTDNFDLRKYITEGKLKIKYPVKEMARPAKETYKLNSAFPQIKDRIKNPSNFKTDRKQQVVNYFIKKGEEQNLNPLEVELFKNDIEKNSAPGINWSFTPDIRTQLLKGTTLKSPPPADEEPGEGDIFLTPDDAEDLFIGKAKIKSQKPTPKTDDEGPSEKDINRIRLPKSTATNSKAGEWLVDNGDLIDKIIKRYLTSVQKVGKIKEGKEELGSGDYKSSLSKSKEDAKVVLSDLVSKLTDKLKKLKEEDHDVYVKVLNDLDKYKFGATKSTGALKMILKALGEDNLPAIEFKRKTNNDSDLKKLGIDDKPIEIDGEELN